MNSAGTFMRALPLSSARETLAPSKNEVETAASCKAAAKATTQAGACLDKCCHVQIQLDENELLQPQPRSTGYRPKLSGTRTPDSGAEIKAPMVAWLPSFEFSPKSKHLPEPTKKERACMVCQEIESMLMLIYMYIYIPYIFFGIWCCKFYIMSIQLGPFVHCTSLLPTSLPTYKP